MNIFKKRLPVLLIMTAVLTTAGFGCQGLSTTEKQATKKTVIEYWTVFDDVSAIRSLLAKYTAQRAYLQVNVRQYSSEEFYDRLVEALAEDKGPDIISISNKEMGRYLSKLQPMPASTQDTTMVTVKKTLKEETVVNSVSVPLPTVRNIESDYVQVVAKDAVRGNKIYGLPLSLDTMALYYNKDILDKSGVAEPPKTWEEFQEAVRKTTKINSKDEIVQSGVALGAGNNIPGADDLLYILYEQSGVPFTAQSGAMVFNYRPKGTDGDSPAGNVMTFFTDYANPERDTYSWNKNMSNALDKFAGGSLAFFFGYSYHYPQIKARGPQINFEVLPMLQLNSDDPKNVATYYLQTVPQKAKNPQIAWGIINYLAVSGNEEYLKLSGRPTARRAFILKQQSDEKLAPFVSQVLIADNWYRGRNYASAQKAISDMLNEWLTAGTSAEPFKAHQEVLDRGASKVNQTL